MSKVELHIDLDGGAVPEDHYYIVYSMLKSKIDGYKDKGVTFLPIDGDRSGDLIELDDSNLILRCPEKHSGDISQSIGDTFVKVGEHILRTGSVQKESLPESPVLKCELCLVTSDYDPRGVRRDELCFQVGKRLGARLGHLDFGCEIGHRRHVHISGTRCFGHTVTVKGVSDEESIALQSDGIGQKTAMGLGQFRSVYH